VTRVTIDRIVVEGVPGLREADVRRHLERELARAIADLDLDLDQGGQTPNRALPVTQTSDARRFAIEVAASVREVLGGR